MGGLEVLGFIFNLICSSFLQLQNSDFSGDIFFCILLSNSGNSLSRVGGSESLRVVALDS
jgi:hypothetical protein